MFERHMDLAQIQSDLTQWLKGKMPQAKDISLSPLKRASAGFANETFFFTLNWKEDGKSRSERKILRIQPQDYPIFLEYDLGVQFYCMDRLWDTDVPVPRVHWLELDTGILGNPFYIADEIQGKVASEVPPYHSYGLCFDATPEQREKMWWEAIETTVKIHRLDWKSMDFSFLGIPGGGTDPIDRHLDYYERYFNWVKKEPQPILDKALEWLKQNRYSPKHVSLCWGDCRIPNLLYNDDFEVVGVLDWEMASINDPESDLGWFFFLDWQHSESYGIPRLKGFPDKEQTVRRYEELIGWKVENLFYHEVLSAFKFGIIIAKIAQNMKQTGAPMPTDDYEIDNPSTQRLAELLDLPAPGGPKREMTDLAQVTVKVQLHLTGPGGRDWYVVSDKGVGTRHEGTIDNPDATLTASAADWDAIQKGELDRVQAFMSGKLKTEGDLTLMLQLEDTISKLSAQG